MRLIKFLILLCACALLFTPSTHAEFYKYVDKNGKSYFVDDLSKIPPEYQDQIKKYEEQVDNLSPEEKEALEHKKEQDALRRQKERQKSLDNHQKWLRYKSRQSQKSQPAFKPPSRTTYTKVVITNGQILVPVLFKHKGKRVNVTLLLDTGANKTLIHKSVGDQLELSGGRKVGVQVVGGATLPARHIALDLMEVGPHKQQNFRVIMIENAGRGFHQGLLGMDFLMGKKYNVDYDKQRIVWSK